MGAVLMSSVYLLRRVLITSFILMCMTSFAHAGTCIQNCGDDSSNTKTGPKISFPFSKIDTLKVPNTWPFDQSPEFLEKHKSFSLNDNSISQQVVDKCVRLLTNWEKNSDEHRQARHGDKCISVLGMWYYNTGRTTPIRDVLLSWATKAKPTFDIYPNDFNPDHYDVMAMLTVLPSLYAVKYDEFEFSQDERQLVDQFLLNELINIPVDVIGEPKEQVFCNPYKHNLIGKNIKGRADIDTCGSNRWKATIAQLLFSLRVGSQELFEEGIYNTRFKLNLFDNEGIYVTWATRGALALDYSHDVTTMLSLMTEIFESAGYDFLGHELENGLQVHDLFKKQFQIVENVSILEKYAKRQYAVKGTNYNKWTKLSNDEKVRKWPKTSLVYSAQTYINKYAPELQALIDCRTSVFSSKTSAITTFNIVDIWDLHYQRVNIGYCNPPKLVGQKEITLTWSTELKSDDYKRVLEAQDIIVYQIKDNGGFVVPITIEYINDTTDSYNHGRENLDIQISENRIMISGAIQVFPDEFLDLDIDADLSAKLSVLEFGDDRFIVEWR